jgi:kynurenine formamidase
VREIPEDSIGPWKPPAYEVTADGKITDAPVPAGPHNWNRWGASDQRGTLNLIDERKAAEAAALVKTGQRFSLALPIGGSIPAFGTRPAVRHLFSRSMADALVGDGFNGMESADDVVVMDLQASTQIDALSHFAAEDLLYNGYWAGAVTARSGARRLGVQHLADGFVTRGVLLDVAAGHDLDPVCGVITGELLEATATAQNAHPRPGDAVLIRTGWLAAALADEAVRLRRRSVGLAVDTLDWLADHDVAFVAVDNRAVEAIPGPPGPLLPLHIGALRDLGMPLGELFDLEDLSRSCTADGVHEFMFVAMPLPVVNAVGSPVNPVAIK